MEKLALENIKNMLFEIHLATACDLGGSKLTKCE